MQIDLDDCNDSKVGVMPKSGSEVAVLDSLINLITNVKSCKAEEYTEFVLFVHASLLQYILKFCTRRVSFCTSHC